MILMYHKIHPNSPTMWWVKVNDFYRQMVELSSKEVVFLKDYDPENSNHVVITFDGVYKNVLEYALPILKKFNYPFELFITSDYIGLDNEFDSIEPNAPFTTINELKELVQGGGRLQWHTKTHINLKTVQDSKIIENELQIPAEIRALDDNGFDWFAYPHGEYNDTVLNLVKQKFKGAVSCNQGNDIDKYVFNRITVVNNTTFKKEKVSCIIASYNYGDYLIDAVESVLKQTIVPDEILISDDCSNDDTQLIAENYVKNYPNLIKYNRNSTNLGIVEHFNKAISLTEHEYVFFLGADNRVLSNYVEECCIVLDRDIKNAIAYTDYVFFGARAEEAYNKIKEEFKTDADSEGIYKVNFPVFDDFEKLKKHLTEINFIHGSSMYKRSAFIKAGGYKTSEKAEDYNLFKRIIEVGFKAEKAKNTFLEYRQHSLYQANNFYSVYKKMEFYKENLNRYVNNKTAFEKSKFYRFAYLMFKTKSFLSKNYNNPRKIFRKIKDKIFK